ncbi:MAG: hypothetical protein ACRD18_17550 [Terriglobia bacterium]
MGRSEPAAIAPHGEGSVCLSAKAPIHPSLRRDVLGLAVNLDGCNLGEVAEAIVDYLC